MRLKCEQEIKAGRETVWDFADDTDNLYRWQPTLESCTKKAGTPGQPGSVAELVYDENGKRIVITETITERRRPDFLAATYETPRLHGLAVHHFVAVGAGTTRWTTWCNFRFRGLMKLAAPFIGGSIRRRMEADMRRFRDLVEGEAR